ncbi:MAG TPA: CocE/NonD family hydrolase [Solirubrobacteraceae bacterium]|nr:CocE/NonD family hydrolase [Solirubrobacteraceae bacterium]
MRRLTLAAALVAALLLPAAAQAAPTHYVKMSDGVEIAVNVKVPDHCKASRRCPASFEMSGYESGSDEGKTPAGHLADETGAPLPLQTGTRAAHAAHFDDRYVTVLASVRGTGCSSGEFDVFSWRSALDGKEVIDTWIARQPWSNGDVVIFGHSYSGLTGMMVAATRPKHLRAVTASGLFADVYRDIVYPGGVSNYGFPLLWTGAVRPLYDVGGGTVGGLYPYEGEVSDRCAQNQAGRSRTVTGEPLVNGLDDTDGEWYRARSLLTYLERIRVPVHVTAAYQDEQTGGRGPTNVFDHLPAGIHRRLVLVNGQHGTQTDRNLLKDRIAWMDYWMLGRERADIGLNTGTVVLRKVFGARTMPTRTSRVLLDYQTDGRVAGEIHSGGFPLTQTRFADVYVTGPDELSWERGGAGTASWFNGSKRQSYSFQAGRNQGGELTSPTGPDELELALPIQRPTAVAGPMTATLFVSSSTPDTELFVQVIDRAPDGTLLYLNRGLLRASHNAIDAEASDKTRDGRIYRPFRPHEQRTLVTPGQPVEYLIDVFPFGHVFQPGHELVVKVSAPPADDNDWMYVAKAPPGVNTLHFGGATPSRLMLPVVPMRYVADYEPVEGQCPYQSMRCLPG